MDYEFLIHPGARSDLLSAPADKRERIRKKLEEMVTNEWRSLMDYDVKKLQGTKNDLYRTRIGGYRIAFAVEQGDNKTRVQIVSVDKREGAYGNTDVFDDRADEF